MGYLACWVFSIHNLAYSLCPVVQQCYAHHKVTVSLTLPIAQSGNYSVWIENCVKVRRLGPQRSFKVTEIIAKDNVLVFSIPFSQSDCSVKNVSNSTLSDRRNAREILIAYSST